MIPSFDSYYLPRWQTFFLLAEQAIVEVSTLFINSNIDSNSKDVYLCFQGKQQIDPNILNEQLLIKAEVPFISSKSIYPTEPIGKTL